MARPRSQDPRSIVRRVRLTKDEDELILASANAAGMTVADYMRSTALAEKRYHSVEEVERDLFPKATVKSQAVEPRPTARPPRWNVQPIPKGPE